MNSFIKWFSSNKKIAVQIIVLLIAIIFLGTNIIFKGYKKNSGTPKKVEPKQENRKVNSVVITEKNWNQFFELDDVVTWNQNAFDETVGMNINKVIKLKSDYNDRVAAESKIAFEISGVIREKKLVLDFVNKKYKIKDKTWSGGLERELERKETVSLVLYENGIDNSVSIYYSSDGEYMINEKKEYTIDVFEKIKIIRVKGDIYLFE